VRSSVTEAAPGAGPTYDDTRRDLVSVAVASLALLAAVAAAARFVGLLIERSDELSAFAYFNGWQLRAVEAALGVVVLGVGSGAATVLARRCRGLRGRTQHGRAVVAAALLPGLFLGSAAMKPMRAALSWASDHTAPAAAARAQFAQWRASYWKAPPVARSPFPAATGPSARALLRVTDLGEGWYAVMRPDPTGGVVSAQLTRAGATGVAHAILSQQHWSGHGWSLDHFLSETAYAFRSAAAARRYVATEPGRRPARRVAGAPVWERLATSNVGTQRTAAFVVGRTAFRLLIDVRNGAPTDAEFDALVAKAISRATPADGH
jgi:hypothetical protein